ncbi:hypothetical protein LshimejAT787_0210670 [Lyophyllum shimeji]|uniref:Uncharacterized protein n=1 Tax=Lyophyllum shimeji TaxID=47721 RepID=A0A9P3UJJ1_LYOSH|nr:hypothetical protein LshimejAT787_0210670 [Lyophyllum shimeji]
MAPNTRFSSYIKPGGLLSRLPTDLKREILETTAHLYPPFAPRLARVSRDIQPWAERIIYHDLYFNGQGQRHPHPHSHFNHASSSSSGADPQLPPFQKFITHTLPARPAAFFAEYVKRLHFDGTFSAAQILPVLRACTGVANLGVYAALDKGPGPGDGDGAQEAEEEQEVWRLVHALPLATLFISSENLTSLLATPPPQSSLQHLARLGLTDAWDVPLARFPAVTHLALVPDVEGQVLASVRAALSVPGERIQQVVVMLNHLYAPRQTRTRTLTALRDLAESEGEGKGAGAGRMVLFTLPVSPRRYVEDDLWDLAREFPDEEQPVVYLGDIPGPRILSFEEVVALGL